jgi:hypothetical protein
LSVWGVVQWQDSGFWLQVSRFKSLHPSHILWVEEDLTPPSPERRGGK